MKVLPFLSSGSSATSAVLVWGAMQKGAAGSGWEGANTAMAVPELVPGLVGIKQVLAGLKQLYVLKNNGTLYGWGNNTGPLGSGNLRGEAVASPQQYRIFAEQWGYPPYAEGDLVYHKDQHWESLSAANNAEPKPGATTWKAVPLPKVEEVVVEGLLIMIRLTSAAPWHGRVLHCGAVFFSEGIGENPTTAGMPKVRPYLPETSRGKVLKNVVHMAAGHNCQAVVKREAGTDTVWVTGVFMGKEYYYEQDTLFTGLTGEKKIAEILITDEALMCRLEDGSVLIRGHNVFGAVATGRTEYEERGALIYPEPWLAYDPASAWVTAHSYALNDRVEVGGAAYKCVLAHTSEAGNKPPNATYWKLDPKVYKKGQEAFDAGERWKVKVAETTGKPSTHTAEWEKTGPFLKGEIAGIGAAGSGKTYECLITNQEQPLANTTYWRLTGTKYTVNEISDKVQYVALGAGRKAIQIAITDKSHAVLLDNHTVLVWGDNAYGQLGLGTFSPQQLENFTTAAFGGRVVCVPTLVKDSLGATLTGVRRIAVGSSAAQAAGAAAVGTGTFMCALMENGKFLTWGSNQEGTLGNGTVASLAVPTPLTTAALSLNGTRSAIAGGLDIAMSATHAIALIGRAKIPPLASVEGVAGVRSAVVKWRNPYYADPGDRTTSWRIRYRLGIPEPHYPVFCKTTKGSTRVEILSLAPWSFADVLFDGIELSSSAWATKAVKRVGGYYALSPVRVTLKHIPGEPPGIYEASKAALYSTGESVTIGLATETISEEQLVGGQGEQLEKLLELPLPNKHEPVEQAEITEELFNALMAKPAWPLPDPTVEIEVKPVYEGFTDNNALKSEAGAVTITYNAEKTKATLSWNSDVQTPAMVANGWYEPGWFLVWGPKPVKGAFKLGAPANRRPQAQQMVARGAGGILSVTVDLTTVGETLVAVAEGSYVPPWTLNPVERPYAGEGFSRSVNVVPSLGAPSKPRQKADPWITQEIVDVAPIGGSEVPERSVVKVLRSSEWSEIPTVLLRRWYAREPGEEGELVPISKWLAAGESELVKGATVTYSQCPAAAGVVGWGIKLFELAKTVAGSARDTAESTPTRTVKNSGAEPPPEEEEPPPEEEVIPSNPLPAAIFTTRDATTFPRADAAMKANNYALKLANQLNYANKKYDYKGEGAKGRFFGYAGIGFGGTEVNGRTRLNWKDGATQGFYIAPPAQPTVKVRLTKGLEDYLSPAEEKAQFGNFGFSIGTTFDAVPMPDPADLFCSLLTLTGEIAVSLKELTNVVVSGPTGVLSNQIERLSGVLLKGPGLPEGGVLVGKGGTTVTKAITLAGEALSQQGLQTYTGYEIFPEGSDKEVVVWSPSTDQMWELLKVTVFPTEHSKAEWEAKGWPSSNIPKAGDWKMGSHGTYIPNVSSWNGVCGYPQNVRAAGLAAIGGNLALEDIVRVLRGGKIGHALGVAIRCGPLPNGKTGSHLEPATSNDSLENTAAVAPATFTCTTATGSDFITSVGSFTYLAVGAVLSLAGFPAGVTVLVLNEGGKAAQLSAKATVSASGVVATIANPAKGYVDAVPEGAWFAFPAGSTATSVGINIATEPLAAAVYEAIREHGLFIDDTSGGACGIAVSDSRALGSPYAFPPNPWAGYEGAGPSPAIIAAYINSRIPGGWEDATLPRLKESVEGSACLLFKMPWHTLEQLQPGTATGVLWAADGEKAGPTDNVFLEWAAYSGAEYNVGNKHPRIKLVTAMDLAHGSNPPLQGSYMYRYELRPGANAFDNERLELIMEPESYDPASVVPVSVAQWTAGTDIWVAHGFYLPAVPKTEVLWSEETNGCVPICQFHPNGNPSPIAGLRIDGTRPGKEPRIQTVGSVIGTSIYLPWTDAVWHYFLWHFVIAKSGGIVEGWHSVEGAPLVSFVSKTGITLPSGVTYIHADQGGPRNEIFPPGGTTEVPPTTVYYHDGWTFASTRGAATLGAFGVAL